MRDAIEGKVLDKMMPLLRLYALFREDVLVWKIQTDLSSVEY
jgi:hypothetical protein